MPTMTHLLEWRQVPQSPFLFIYFLDGHKANEISSAGFVSS